MQFQDRTVVHMDMDTFFVSVERLINSGLRGKPVIIGSLSDRGVVASCSYEARMFGVHSAMPMKMALNLCRDAIVIRGDMDLYSKYSALVTEVIAGRAPLYEKASIDEHYLDITGMDKFFGACKWTHELRQTIINETGLPVSCGLSINKTVSKIAAGEAKPNGEKQVEKDSVIPFLYPLPIRKMPMIGLKTCNLLTSMGVSTIGVLRSIPVEMIESVLGKNGIEIWKRANGIDLSPVVPYSEEKSISTEKTFGTDTIDVNMLEQLIITMTEKLCFRLRKKEKLASVVTVKIRYANYDTHTLQSRIAYTSLDHLLIGKAAELFKRLYQRRMLVRLVGVKLGGLIQGAQQLSLFDDNGSRTRLYLSMDKIRMRYGSAAIRRASGLVCK
ncbi:MAG: DNA polymerase IV [Prolixibacteraceae bacterium]|nr:DNA polymerase IV [Prolixibacteraceae bacterium]MDD4756499.1 DNA polymerase IV [Prolixibacteraceae bacterium]NLO03082.1 DNA polymerase IV [Bacteroidales bacterium]